MTNRGTVRVDEVDENEWRTLCDMIGPSPTRKGCLSFWISSLKSWMLAGKRLPRRRERPRLPQTTFNLRRRLAQSYSDQRRKRSAPLVPPKPKEFDMAYSS